jgi:hypothetical protein
MCEAWTSGMEKVPGWKRCQDGKGARHLFKYDSTERRTPQIAALVAVHPARPSRFFSALPSSSCPRCLCGSFPPCRQPNRRALDSRCSALDLYSVNTHSWPRAFTPANSCQPNSILRATRSTHSAIRNPQSEIRNPKSEIRNPKSPQTTALGLSSSPRIGGLSCSPLPGGGRKSLMKSPPASAKLDRAPVAAAL